MGGGGQQSAEIQFVINGPDIAKLQKYAQQVAAETRKVPGAVDVDISLNPGQAGTRRSRWTARRPRTSACRSATRPTRCGCWSAATR